jgi:hypothetical protein
MMRIRPEEGFIVSATARLLQRIGVKLQMREVQFCEKFLDLYARGKGSSYVAVEAKVFSPTRAFKQASLYALIARKVYVAEMATVGDSRAKELANQTGIGLILVRRTKIGRYVAKISVKAKPSPIFEPRLANTLWNHAQRIYS